jgi:hypothetical protein
MQVHGMLGHHVNRDDNIDYAYLPILMGYHSHYKQYIKSLGFDVEMTAIGGFIVIADEDGKEVDPGEYVSFPMYFNFWKRNYKKMKVSRLVEDICKDCDIFASRHRYLANHTSSRQHYDDDKSNIDSTADEDTNNDNDCVEKYSASLMEFDLNQLEAASDQTGELREQLLLEAAEHMKMARVQRNFYQEMVANAVADAKADKDHSLWQYTFVVYYGQNMELPVYNKEQPGIMYYHSPLSIYNLGIVDHAHVYA